MLYIHTKKHWRSSDKTVVMCASLRSNSYTRAPGDLNFSMTLNVSHPINPKISGVVFASRTQSQDCISSRRSWAPQRPGGFSVNSSLILTRVCPVRDAIGARRACVFLATPQGAHTWKRALALWAVSLGARRSVLGGRCCSRQRGVSGARRSTRKTQPLLFPCAHLVFGLEPQAPSLLISHWLCPRSSPLSEDTHQRNAPS